MGIRMGQIGLEALDAKEHRDSLCISLKVPFRVPYSCVIDGIQTSTRCTVGNQKLQVVNAEEIEAKFEDLNNKQSITIMPQPTVLTMLKKQVIDKDSTQEEICRLAWDIASMSTKTLLIVKNKKKKRERYA
jgi:formylmethanofuran dehydrogenase subunit E